MKIITIYATVGNSDMTEGRGRAVDLEYFKTRAGAEAGAIGSGVFGSKADVEERYAVVIDNKYYLLRDKKPLTFGEDVAKIAEQKKKVWDKLRPEEQALFSADERRAFGV